MIRLIHLLPFLIFTVFCLYVLSYADKLNSTLVILKPILEKKILSDYQCPRWILRMSSSKTANRKSQYV